MSVLGYLEDALRALLPQGALALAPKALVGRGLALLLFALLLSLARFVLRRLSDLAFNRFGLRVRRSVAGPWNLLFCRGRGDR